MGHEDLSIPGTDGILRTRALTMEEVEHSDIDTSGYRKEHLINSADISAEPDKNGYWQDQAACGGQGELFYPPNGRHEYKEEKQKRERQAKAICGKCAVRAECLDYAQSHKEKHGIWGGLTEEERGR